MLSEKLKENTKISHQFLEKKLITRMRSIQSKDDYAKFLALFYSYFGGLEMEIDKHLDLAYFTDYEKRRKTSALAADLVALKTSLPELADENILPEISNHCQALGALYVIEGSTLGGAVICKMLGQQMGLSSSLGMSFFNGYGSQTASMWQIFKQSIDQPSLELKHDTIIQSADQTFIQFSHWFDIN